MVVVAVDMTNMGMGMVMVMVLSVLCSHGYRRFLPCPAAALLGSGPSVQAQGEASQQPSVT